MNWLELYCLVGLVVWLCVTLGLLVQRGSATWNRGYGLSAVIADFVTVLGCSLGWPILMFCVGLKFGKEIDGASRKVR